MELYQAVSEGKKDLCSVYQLCGAIPSCSMGKGPAGGLLWVSCMCVLHCHSRVMEGSAGVFLLGIKCVELYHAVEGSNNDLLVVCNGYQVCVLCQAIAVAKDLVVVYNV